MAELQFAAMPSPVKGQVFEREKQSLRRLILNKVTVAATVAHFRALTAQHEAKGQEGSFCHPLGPLKERPPYNGRLGSIENMSAQKIKHEIDVHKSCYDSVQGQMGQKLGAIRTAIQGLPEKTVVYWQQRVRRDDYF